MPDDARSLLTRPSLLERLKDWGQHTAWRTFEGDYAPLVRNVACKAGLTDAEADEVVQETLIAVAKKIAEFEHSGNAGSFRSWLYQQTRWRIADQFRLRKKVAVWASRPTTGDSEDAESANDQSEDVPAAEDTAFDQIWDAEWTEHVRQLAVDRVKRQVSARQFQLFDLHVLQGLGVGEAARAAEPQWQRFTWPKVESPEFLNVNSSWLPRARIPWRTRDHVIFNVIGGVTGQRKV